ncbi:MAG: single-stranded DNA-binding protein [Candidatus Izemoplasma sp.]
MLNQVILVGRLVYDPELKTLDDGRKVTTITLAVNRSYKNAETGEYDTDFIKCTLWSGIAENTVEYCKKGSTVGIKARLAQKYYDLGNDKSFSYPEVVAEKITFINTKTD